MKTIHLPQIYVLPYQVQSAEINMATDRYLLGMPGTFLRFYGWDHPTLSFGRMTRKVDDIDLEYCRNHDIRLVKRISGGKTVLHHHELTYSFISDTALFPDSVVDTYRIISQILLNSFQYFGLGTEMSADKADDTDSSICFREASAFELTVNSKKLVGSAQYRKRDRFFQHGSILLDIDWQAWKQIWRLPDDSTELESRITCINRELTDRPTITDLVTVITEAFGSFFKAKMVEPVLTQQDREEISVLSKKYVWQSV